MINEVSGSGNNRGQLGQTKLYADLPHKRKCKTPESNPIQDRNLNGHTEDSVSPSKVPWSMSCSVCFGLNVLLPLPPSLSGTLHASILPFLDASIPNMFICESLDLSFLSPLVLHFLFRVCV